MHPEQLLLTKCLVPIVPQPIIERPRLHQLLTAGLSRRLTVVSASAGFGKTTLVASWARAQTNDRRSEEGAPNPAGMPEPQVVSWVSLEGSDNTPAPFWLYVFTALEQHLPQAARGALNAMQASPDGPLDAVLVAFINARLAQPTPGVLVLDDYQLITNVEIHRLLLFLLEHLPPQLHVMLLSRTEPPLPLARLRANRQVHDIGVNDLRCTVEEAAAFLHSVMDVHLSDDIVQQMTLRTEGWLVGLQLLGLSLQGRRDAKAVLEELRGTQRHVFDYLMDEVLRQQPEDWQHFLLQSSILERMSAPLCDAVLERGDSQAMLEHLVRANLFVNVLDERRQWYFYNRLFRDALQTRLQAAAPEVARSLHLRATEWFSARGDNFLVAIHVLQAEAWTQAGRLSGTERKLQAARVTAARALMVALEGRTAQAREQIRIAQGFVPADHVLEQAALMVALNAAAVVDGDLTAAARLSLQAADLMRQAGQPVNAFNMAIRVATYLHRQGRLDEAEEVLNRTMNEAIELDSAAAMSFISTTRALLLLERSRLDAALDLALDAARLVRQEGYDTTYGFGYPNLASVHLARHEYPEAQAAVTQAVQMLPEHDPPFARTVKITPIQVRLWLAQGDLEQAQAWAAHLKFGPGPASAFAREQVDVSRIRVSLASGSFREALGALPDLIAGATRQERWLHVLEMWLLQAIAHHQSGDAPAALTVTERAVVFGEPQGYVQRFLDEGPVVAALLSRLRHQPVKPRLASYLDRLLAEFPAAGPDPVLPEPALRGTPVTAELSGPERISAREMEVLELLARGLTNHDITRYLAIGRQTVKTHVGKLLSKLEARNRTHAVARARALGLLKDGP